MTTRNLSESDKRELLAPKLIDHITDIVRHCDIYFNGKVYRIDDFNDHCSQRMDNTTYYIHEIEPEDDEEIREIEEDSKEGQEIIEAYHQAIKGMGVL